MLALVIAASIIGLSCVCLYVAVLVSKAVEPGNVLNYDVDTETSDETYRKVLAGLEQAKAGKVTTRKTKKTGKRK